jgi:hypothetical protein
MAHDNTAADVPFARLDPVPGTLRGAIVALIVIGLISFIAALFTNADRAWHAWLFNWLYFTSLAQGAGIVAVMVSITRGAWSRTIRRIALAFVAFLPIAFLLMLPMLFAADHIFPWLHEPVPGKEAWLNRPFLIIRNVVLLAALFTLTILFAIKSLRPDLGTFRSHAGKASALWDRLTRDWRGPEAEEAAAHRSLAKLGPAIALVWAVALSVVAWDFIMSLEPHWFSTLLGPYFFMAGLLGGLAATGIAANAITGSLNLRNVIATSQWHDLGKLTFGFVVFWAYLFFSQFIVIWYGLIPGEQSFIVHRFTAPFNTIARLTFILLWVIPFFSLLSAAAKKNPKVLTIFCGIILTGLWFERYLLVYPSLNIGADNVPLGWQEIGTGLLFAGLLIGAITWFCARFPIFQIWQPMSEIELRGLPAEVRENASV